MNVVLSRKGFDSAAGGAPSPIIDGKPTSIPIPALDRSDTTYDDLGLGKLVQQLTRGKLTGASLCHCDPMFEKGRCAFGQTGASQTHLANNGVGIGDVFLFYGLFSDVDGGDRHHRIFGYLKIEEILKPGSKPTKARQPKGFPVRHPHTIGVWNDNNSIYVGPGKVASQDRPNLRLSIPGGPVSHWRIPTWLRDTGLSYHHNPKRWLSNGVLHTTSPGQEFVADISGNAAAAKWLERVIGLIGK
ncbi:MAG: hypothetical protein OXG15_03290 [Gammaproteobacteria bacterium]|nr:hypothetical protein [Gammaproteobacteria bacterium]